MNFVFNKTNDQKGNVYYACYSNIETQTTICINGMNFILRGSPKITARIGKSSFGNELIFDFKISRIKEEYKTDTPHKTIEYYLPLKEGIKFLEESLKKLKEELGDENNEPKNKI